MNVATALQMTDPVVARIERSCSINGRAVVVSDGDGLDRRQHIALSTGWFRLINHQHPGLLFLVATTPDEASRYVAALTLNPATIPTVAAD